MTQSVVLSGVGLHTGRPVSVTLHLSHGPVRLASPRGEAPLDALVVVSTVRATTVESHDGRIRVGTVEHALAALAGLGIHDDITLHVDGPEMPLLDGGATTWCEALARLGLPRSHPPARDRREVRPEPRLRVSRHAVVDVGDSRFELTPADGVDVSVHIDLADDRLTAGARWQGDPVDFVERIAPARTFALSRDVEDLVRRGLARHVDPHSVVVLAPDAIHSAGLPFSPDEPARHKLLDLLGDLYLHGGPPIGRVHAIRPGHSANALAIKRALDEGILERL